MWSRPPHLWSDHRSAASQDRNRRGERHSLHLRVCCRGAWRFLERHARGREICDAGLPETAMARRERGSACRVRSRMQARPTGARPPQRSGRRDRRRRFRRWLERCLCLRPMRTESKQRKGSWTDAELVSEVRRSVAAIVRSRFLSMFDKQGGIQMPFGDKTGPLGQGPMTGRGRGFCAGGTTPGAMNPAPGFNMGRGRGGGRGWRNRFRAAGPHAGATPAAAAPAPAEQEVAALKTAIDNLRDTLDAIKKRVEAFDVK